MKKKKMTHKKENFRGYTIMTWVVILVLWLCATEFGWVSSRLVPSPIQVIKTFVTIVSSGYNGISFWQHFGISLFRLVVATSLAIVTAIPLGLLSGYLPRVRAVIDSIVQFYRPLPPLAYYTLLILWLGIDESSKILLLYLAAFAPIYLACASSVGKIPENYLLNAQSLGASSKDVFFKVVLPSCLPEIFTGLRTAVGVAYTTLVSAEMIAATSGIGWMVIDASRYLKSDVMFVGIIMMGITGVLLDVGLRRLEKKFVFWKGKDA
ncbi:ABC transporter permease [Vagococcus lutrae]|nr:ABC transporter permease [Vagococcus lutrae]MCO7151138.1 ABC transporter permease [Vagococcus lutrae]MDT2802376.1 ABC transporter permease [Vagococcus lutrae]MDT2806242.1 ABC transporter permease [Vagococcus lutrae]MDT2811389.1 ABC transporter permease [Vagococcus lutrae]MDT2817041.1 ABC transporter permease [Vagococcus lutrae]